MSADPEVADFVERAAAPGTTAYLPILFAAATHREHLGVVFALRGEIGRSLAADLAPEVASTRLSWWGEEAGRIVAGQPRHPLSRHLANAVGISALADARTVGLLLAELVGATQASLAEPVPANWSALIHRMTHDWGALCRLMTRLLATPDQAEAPWVDPWANALGTACAIDEALASPDTPTLPALSPYLASEDDEEKRRAAWRTHALTALGTATSTLPACARAEQRPLLVLASLVHRRITRAPTPPGDRYLARSLGDLWCAWRGAQRAARGDLPSHLACSATVDSPHE